MLERLTKYRPHVKRSIGKKIAEAVSEEAKLLSKIFDFETAISVLSKYKLNSIQNQLEVSQDNFKEYYIG